jgi:hypothetical protein
MPPPRYFPVDCKLDSLHHVDGSKRLMEQRAERNVASLER